MLPRNEVSNPAWLRGFTGRTQQPRRKGSNPTSSELLFWSLFTTCLLASRPHLSSTLQEPHIAISLDSGAKFGGFSKEIHRFRLDLPIDFSAVAVAGVIDDHHGLRLFACENESNHPANDSDTEKNIENDDSNLVRTVSLYGHDCWKKIESQYAK